ncbi:uncharacterized protein LOC100891360 [Strongylocentrotus purpuratus]|uniref:Uncharacterized protein n=1 Tax=Strongylocentrotus purpuratus TaxID=7668 RepID=A0A7M7GEG2_STRPU|nr:uncharacterized protein LOC100891360 [Strongylocentrotus purpuratus]|eukprot:XP_003723645.1 PREDICTED: uncharacterized protein LOC100891360 [Strongylocentrotus purpuratus]
MAVSSYLVLFVVICSIGAISSLKTSDTTVDRKTSNPYTDSKRKDISDMDLDDVIGISLGDHRREVWSEILMTPELKANKMSLNRKNKRAKKHKMKLHGKKEGPSPMPSMPLKKLKETPFDKYLPRRNSKI